MIRVFVFEKSKGENKSSKNSIRVLVCFYGGWDSGQSFWERTKRISAFITWKMAGIRNNVESHRIFANFEICFLRDLGRNWQKARWIEQKMIIVWFHGYKLHVNNTWFAHNLGFERGLYTVYNILYDDYALLWSSRSQIFSKLISIRIYVEKMKLLT